MFVDELQLWTSGVLDLSGQELAIYYGFVEGEAEDGGNPLNCSATIVSTSTTGASIDYSLFGNASLIQALGAIDNISYFIDDDPKMETALTETHTANVAARVTIPVNLGRTVDFRNEIGVVMRKDTYVAEVEVGSGMTIYTRYQGTDTGDSFSNWGVLGADVAGYGDKQIFYIHPTTICDEIVIDYGNGISLLSNPEFYGIFLRADSDADGIPDCQDPCSCFSNIDKIQPGSVCAGTKLEIVATGNPGNKYKIKFTDPAALEYFKGQLDEDGCLIIEATSGVNSDNINISYQTVNPGQYHLTFFDNEGKTISTATYYVHPLETEWRTNAASSDWTNWSNWSQGTPYCCTNVIIPSNAKNYPILYQSIVNEDKADDSDESYIFDKFCCNNIFIRPGAFIGSVNKLNYNKAWVQMELSPNRYNLISAPLQGMVTGDMFIPAKSEGIDEPENMFTSHIPEENRFNPTIYQRMWYIAVQERIFGNESYKNLEELDENVDGMTFTKWSQTFNHLNTPYKSGMGFSMWVDNGRLPESTKFRFTFPKENTTYKYFDDFTQKPVSPEQIETLTRENENSIGRFIYETEAISGPWVYNNNGSNENRSLYEIPESVEIKAEDNTEYFLFGNPFMSPINAREFIRRNEQSINGIMTYDGNTTASLVYDEGKFTSSDIEVIPPMTAVLVIAKENDSKELTVTLDEDMIDADYMVQDIEDVANGISVRAKSGELTSSMVALTESEIQNYALFDNEVVPRLAIFSVVDGEACDIVTAKEDIPLTIIADANAEIALDFLSYGVNRDDWKLVDYATKTEYSLDHEVNLPAGTGTSSGRFPLTRGNDSAGIKNVVDDPHTVYLTVHGNDIVANSTAGSLISMEVYDLSGKNVALARGPQPTLTATVNQGIYVVRVKTENGITSHKVLVR